MSREVRRIKSLSTAPTAMLFDHRAEGGWMLLPWLAKGLTLYAFMNVYEAFHTSAGYRVSSLNDSPLSKDSYEGTETGKSRIITVLLGVDFDVGNGVLQSIRYLTNGKEKVPSRVKPTSDPRHFWLVKSQANQAHPPAHLQAQLTCISPPPP